MQEMKPVKEGKVREIYDNGDSLIMVATDRISCFDVILNNEVTKKGTVPVSYTHLLSEAAFQVWESSLITTVFGFLKNSRIYKFHDKPPENKNNILKINFNYKRLSW